MHRLSPIAPTTAPGPAQQATQKPENEIVPLRPIHPIGKAKYPRRTPHQTRANRRKTGINRTQNRYPLRQRRPITEDAMNTAPQPPKSRALGRAIRLATVASSLVAVALVGGISWVGSERAIHRPARTFAWQLADYPALRPEAVVVTGHNGITLAGTFFPGSSAATIILSHGYGTNQIEMLPWADFLVRAGYSVFTYDMRARGASGGDAITLGALEQHDLIAILDYLTGRPDVDPARIGALGLSLGGAVSIMAAARDGRIKAIVDDSGFSDVDSAIGTAYEQFIGLPAFPFAPLSVRIGELRTGQRLGQSRPVDVIGQLAPRPILIIHGGDDREVPPAHSERNHAAARDPKELWIVPNARHAQSRATATAEYERRVVAFFHQHLRP